MAKDTRDHNAGLNPAGHTRRRLIATATTLFVLPVLPSLSQAATILAVRTWPADEYTRVTLEMDSELKAEHFTLDGPDRLVVDIQGLSMSQALNTLISKIQPNDPYISTVRVGQNRPDVVRLVLDLKQAIAPQVFTLKPIGEYKYRLVLDLYPKIAQDPLLAIMENMESDPLAEVLENLARNEPAVPAPVPSVQGQRTPPPPPVAQKPPPPSRPPAAPPPAARPARPILIALDAGHGGEDPGAVGPGGTYEKDVVLQIVRRVKERIDRIPGVRAVLTRDGDYFVPLNTRVLKARQANADLFISVHADAAPRRSANGASVYALSDRGASSTTAKWLAQKENAADLIGGLNIGTQDQLIAKVLLDLSTTAQINDSLKLGGFLLQEIGRINRL